VRGPVWEFGLTTSTLSKSGRKKACRLARLSRSRGSARQAAKKVTGDPLTRPVSWELAEIVYRILVEERPYEVR